MDFKKLDEEFDEKFCHAVEMSGLTAFKDSYTGQEVKSFLHQKLLERDGEWYEEMTKVVAEEMIIAHQEGQPTSRLTSLAVKLSEFKDSKVINEMKK